MGKAKQGEFGVGLRATCCKTADNGGPWTGMVGFEESTIAERWGVMDAKWKCLTVPCKGKAGPTGGGIRLEKAWHPVRMSCC